MTRIEPLSTWLQREINALAESRDGPATGAELAQVVGDWIAEWRKAHRRPGADNMVDELASAVRRDD